MKYNKPELTNLGDAASVILGQPKPTLGLIDPFDPKHPRNFVPGYELDE